MSFSIDNFKANLLAGGHRTSNFSLNITNPIDGIADFRVPLLAKSSQMPESNIAPLDVSYFGRKIKLAGQRTYQDWTVTIINDEDFMIRNAMEAWSHAINGASTNLRSASAASPLQYKSDAQVTLYSKTGLPVRTYNMRGIWPSVVSSVDLDWETEGISQFSVTFAIDYWDVSGITGSGGTGSSFESIAQTVAGAVL